MYPDFLCIGAQKAGTSWLYQNLGQHPGIWLPPVKEIHYFDYRHFGLRDVLKGLATGERGHLRAALGQLLRHGMHLTAGDRMMLVRYLTRARNDLWYQSLFELARPRITGDFTPAYARLKFEDIAYIHKRMREARVIYLLRNPIDRAWSHAIMRFSRSGLKLEEPWSKELISFLRSQADFSNDGKAGHHHKSSDYLGNLDRWGKLYPPDQILVGFLDEVASQPRQFLLRVFRFLDVDASPDHVPSTAEEKVFARAGRVPPFIASLLADLYRPTLIRLHEHFANEYTKAWLEYADRQHAPLGYLRSGEP